MRISINQKPGSNRNFGFAMSQNPSGVFVKSIEEGKYQYLTLAFYWERKEKEGKGRAGKGRKEKKSGKEKDRKGERKGERERKGKES